MNVPVNFGYCIADAAQCPLASRCLRAKAFECKRGEMEEQSFVNTVNPYLKGINYATAQCAKYVAAEQVRFATGMKHIYDNVPLYLLDTLREKVCLQFSSPRIYYYCRAGKRLISPATQVAIAKVFGRYGIAEPPKFDHYVMEYDWNG